MASIASSCRSARQATPASRCSSRPFGCSLRHPARLRQLPVARVANVTQDSFEAEVLQASASQPVLVDFWANWCGPCKLVAPMMDWAEKEFAGHNLKVVKVEHDGNPKLIAEFKVYGLPALAMFKDGKLIEGSKREGVITKAQLGDYIKKNIA